MQRYWLLKSEPSCFSIEHLKQSPKQTTSWDGVRNYQARNFMRDKMQPGDLAFFYHSNCTPPGIVGIAEIVSPAYPDHTAQDPENEHYDPRSTMDNPRWCMVDVRFKSAFSNIISLETLKNHPGLEHMPLVRKGNRLSVLPVSTDEWYAILDLAEDI
jgi:predicted RNA-binding protein with PUA-like domain